MLVVIATNIIDKDACVFTARYTVMLDRACTNYDRACEAFLTADLHYGRARNFLVVHKVFVR